METAVFDPARAFGATDRLFGVGAYARLAAAQVAVVGVGGVGSWAAEALARAGVGTLTLIDLDQVAESNVNRQIMALTNTVGQAKVDALRARIALINPTCVVHSVEAFMEVENPGTHLPAQSDFVLDCVDAARVKVALIAHCRERKIPLVVCGAAGGKVDATQLRELDLAHTTHDSLLASVRAQLRKKYSLSNDKKLNVRCVSSAEPRMGAAPSAGAGTALACAGYGSLVTVTASMGMIAAGIAIREISRA
jgi:tRNA A37 threonylcarbamoyladenosine dehydratase